MSDAYSNIQERMKALGLAFTASEIAAWSSESCIAEDKLEIISSFFDAVICRKQSERASFLMKISRIPESCEKTFDNYDFGRLLGNDKSILMQLKSLGFVHSGQTVAFFGNTGTGKTHLAAALGRECCIRGIPAYFITMQDLANKMAKAISDGKTAKFLNGMSAQRCLIIDEMDHCSLDRQQTILFFQLVDKRYKKRNGSIVITSNRQPSEWGALFADKETGECILDRLFDHLISVSFNGSSYRGADRLLLNFKAKAANPGLK